MEKIMSVEVVKPLSVEKAEKRRTENGWCALIPTLMFIGIGYMMLRDSSDITVFEGILGIVSMGCSLIGAIGFGVGWMSSDKEYNEAHERFVETFGDDPTENPDATQIMVDSVLGCLKRSVQGTLERELGAYRKHELYMTDKTACSLAKRRVETADAKDSLEDAVESALDWRYTVPEGIHDFEKK